MAVARRAMQGAILAVLLLAGSAQAQQAAPVVAPVPAADPVTVPGADERVGESAAQTDVTTLGEVRALRPDDEQPLDLYRFKNPMRAEDNRFSRNWSEPPSPEQVSMSGGYLMMGVVKGVAAAAKGLNKITGGPDQIQAAIARPPPELSAEQQRRALQFCAQQEGCGAPPQE